MQPQMSPAPAFIESSLKSQGNFKRVIHGNKCDDVVRYDVSGTTAAFNVVIPEDKDGNIDHAALDKILETGNQPIVLDEHNDVKHFYLAGGSHETVGIKVAYGKTSAPARSEQQTVSPAALAAIKEKQQMDKEKDEYMARLEYEDKIAQRAHELKMMEMQLRLAEIQASRVPATPASSNLAPSRAQQSLPARQGLAWGFESYGNTGYDS